MPTDIGVNSGLLAGFYGWYYCSQAMFQLGGKHWEGWAPRMYDILLKSQQQDGSWPAERGGATYSTALAVLAMAVTYHQLPIYQR
jgi:hypothetical protein